MSEKIDPEEWRAYLAKLFPSQILGCARPSDPIPTELEFSTNFPQWIRKDPAFYMQLNAVFMQVFSNDADLADRVDQQVISSPYEPEDQREGGIWLEELSGGDEGDDGAGENSRSKMVLSSAPPDDQEVLWGDLNNDGDGKNTVNGGNMIVEIEISDTEPLDKNVIWGLLNPTNKKGER